VEANTFTPAVTANAGRSSELLGFHPDARLLIVDNDDFGMYHAIKLLDKAGVLFPPAQIPRLLAQARIEDVAREFRAQIDAVIEDGLAPTHLDWHCLADGGREDIFDLTVALAAEYGLAVRAWLEPGHQRLRRQGLPVIDHESSAHCARSSASRNVRLCQDEDGSGRWPLCSISAP
jgi:predicted glycoside hydrolase/deacetylase ChbG (UPF0249 family)